MNARAWRIQMDDGSTVDVDWREPSGPPPARRRSSWTRGRKFAAVVFAAGLLFELWLGAWALPNAGLLPAFVVHAMAVLMAIFCVPLLRHWPATA